MPDNDWAEKAAREIIEACRKYIPNEMEFVDGKVVKDTLQPLVDYRDHILRHTAPEFAVLEKALEMACDNHPDGRSDNPEYFKAKAREEVGNG